MLTEQSKALLEKQHYAIIGEHSAVKTCGWTKSMVKGEGGCYKLKFYGIMSNQCMQMTTSISCANRCTFCWRDYKAPVSKEWKWGVDDPSFILEGSLTAHHQFLSGFKASPHVHEGALKKSKDVRHVALSLTGEPIFYPRMNEIVDEFHKKGISTFLVTNAQYPDQIRDLKPVTQLYISLDAPTKEMLKSVDKPLFIDYWGRLNKSLEHLAAKKQRTCIRLTMMKGINMENFPAYATMITRGDPDFIEVKAYMFLGASKLRMKASHMPLHEEIVTFSKELVKFLPEYEICSEHIPSRVVMIAKKKYRKESCWHTWIDFKKFTELATSGKEFSTDDYLRRTPQTGLSGKGTLERMPAHVRKRFEGNLYKINETTEEMEFYKEEEKESLQGEGC